MASVKEGLLILVLCVVFFFFYANKDEIWELADKVYNFNYELDTMIRQDLGLEINHHPSEEPEEPEVYLWLNYIDGEIRFGKISFNREEQAWIFAKLKREYLAEKAQNDTISKNLRVEDSNDIFNNVINKV